MLLLHENSTIQRSSYLLQIRAFANYLRFVLGFCWLAIPCFSLQYHFRRCFSIIRRDKFRMVGRETISKNVTSTTESSPPESETAVQKYVTDSTGREKTPDSRVRAYGSNSVNAQSVIRIVQSGTPEIARSRSREYFSVLASMSPDPERK